MIHLRSGFRLSAALSLIFQSWDGIVVTVLEGQRIARFFSEDWEESPNTEGRDAA